MKRSIRVYLSADRMVGNPRNVELASTWADEAFRRIGLGFPKHERDALDLRFATQVEGTPERIEIEGFGDEETRVREQVVRVLNVIQRDFARQV